MKILVDENMPYARELFSRLGDVQAVPGRPVPAEALTDADALMVRSVTRVNEALLSGKAVKFVGTATAGTDHVDQAWLQQAGIGFSAAPGCNAIAVVERWELKRYSAIRRAPNAETKAISALSMRWSRKPMSSPSIPRCIKKGHIKPSIWRMSR